MRRERASSETISVIIPVYNVAPYLDQCIESVVAQSYSKLEIILIDDGSTDQCGAMCDAWADRDPRIRILHKENGGLSDARNAGLDIAGGDYIAFVDSDDCIAVDMLEKLFHALSVNNADISICNYLEIDEKGRLIPGKKSSLGDGLLTGTEALVFMITGNARVEMIIAYNKLYRKELFSSLRYPKGKLCEDVFIAHELYGRCKTVACIHDSCYYYRLRTGSIMHSGNPLIPLHQAQARIERMIYCYEHQLYRCAGLAYYAAAWYLPDIFFNGEKAEPLMGDISDCLLALDEHSYMKKYCTYRERLACKLICVSPKSYYRFVRKPDRKIRLFLGKAGRAVRKLYSGKEVE